METRTRRPFALARGVVLILTLGIGIPLFLFQQVGVALVTLPSPGVV